MRQIIVGGDNEDAYHICDAFLEHAKGTGVPVLFCTTPQEVLTNLSRGGADVVVLSFESAGLTNYELAHRIRDMGEEGNVPLLLSEVDALGDVKAVLGPRVDVFAYPANPGNVLARAKPFLDQAAEEHKAVAARAKKPDPPKPTIAGDRVPRPELQRLPPAGENGAAAAGKEAPERSRRVRHRSWNEVRNPGGKDAKGHKGTAETFVPDDEDIVVYDTARAKPGTKPDRRLFLVLAIVVVLAALYAGYGFLTGAFGGGEDDGGGVAVVQCASCGYRDTMKVDDIHEVRCRKCGGPVGFAFHCNDCKKDFPYMPPGDVKTPDQIPGKIECAHCKSWNITRVKPDNAEPEDRANTKDKDKTKDKAKDKDLEDE